MSEPPRADRYLRSWGFAIVGRPKNGEPTWRDRLTGKVMVETAAIAAARKREKASRIERV